MSRLLLTNYVTVIGNAKLLLGQKNYLYSLCSSTQTQAHMHTHTHRCIAMYKHTQRAEVLSFIWQQVCGYWGNGKKTWQPDKDRRRNLSLLYSIFEGIDKSRHFNLLGQNKCFEALLVGPGQPNGLLLQWQKQHQSADVSYRHNFLMDPWPNSFYGKTGHTLCLSVWYTSSHCLQGPAAMYCTLNVNQRSSSILGIYTIFLLRAETIEIPPSYLSVKDS